MAKLRLRLMAKRREPIAVVGREAWCCERWVGMVVVVQLAWWLVHEWLRLRLRLELLLLLLLELVMLLRVMMLVVLNWCGGRHWSLATRKVGAELLVVPAETVKQTTLRGWRRRGHHVIVTSTSTNAPTAATTAFRLLALHLAHAHLGVERLRVLLLLAPLLLLPVGVGHRSRLISMLCVCCVSFRS